MKKFDELAFVNEQLALMLRSGITLESGISEIVGRLRKSDYTRELESFRMDLARGMDFDKAVKARNFDTFYKNLLIIGAKSNRLPEAFDAIAGYYKDNSFLLTQITSLLVYPAIVLFFAFALSIFNSTMILPVAEKFYNFWGHCNVEHNDIQLVYVANFLIPSFILLLLLLLIIFYANRKLLVWKVPPFRDFKIAHSARLIAICLESGIALDKAFEMLAELEPKSIKEQLLAPVKALSAGINVASALEKCSLFPAFFQYLVLHSSDRLSEGFKAVSRQYFERADNRKNLLLHLVCPVAVCIIAFLILIQIYATVSSLAKLLQPILTT